MRKASWFLIRVVFPLATAGYSSLAYALVPNIKITVESPSRPVLSGETNLPDGAEILLTVTRPQSRYQAASTVKVSGGHFRSEQFSQHGSDLNSGTYTIQAVMGYSEIQPAAVRTIIGQHGEKMTGPLVQHSKMGKTVRYLTSFQFGTAPSAKADKASRDRDKKNLTRWRIETCGSLVDRITPTSILGLRQAKIDKCVYDMQHGKS